MPSNRVCCAHFGSVFAIDHAPAYFLHFLFLNYQHPYRFLDVGSCCVCSGGGLVAALWWYACSGSVLALIKLRFTFRISMSYAASDFTLPLRRNSVFFRVMWLFVFGCEIKSLQVITVSRSHVAHRSGALGVHRMLRFVVQVGLVYSRVCLYSSVFVYLLVRVDFWSRIMARVFGRRILFSFVFVVDACLPVVPLFVFVLFVVCLFFFVGLLVTALRVHPAVTRLTVYRRP